MRFFFVITYHNMFNVWPRDAKQSDSPVEEERATQEGCWGPSRCSSRAHQSAALHLPRGPCRELPAPPAGLSSCRGPSPVGTAAETCVASGHRLGAQRHRQLARPVASAKLRKLLSLCFLIYKIGNHWIVG